MRPPEIRYTKNGAASLAYQVLGQASVDFVVLPGLFTNLEIQAENPDFSQWARQLATFTRLILLDRRGTGLSDRHFAADADPVDVAVQDLCAVIDAAGCGRVAVLGGFDSAATAFRFAVKFPGRIRALIFYAPASAQSVAALKQSIELRWGNGDTANAIAPGQAGDARFQAWWARYERLCASPAEAAKLLHHGDDLSHMARLAPMTYPVLFLHRKGDHLASFKQTQALSRSLPKARFVELEGADHLIWSGYHAEINDVLQQFLTNANPTPRSNLMLATLWVARVVMSERLVLRYGEGSWQDRLRTLTNAANDAILRHGGQQLATELATFCARFDSPTTAIHVALAIRAEAQTLGLPLAAGLHIGEVDRDSDPFAGLAFMVADEIARQAKPEELIASRTIADVVTGLGLRFTPREPLVLDGTTGPVHLVSIATEQHLEPTRTPDHEPDLSLLSSREREVLKLIAEGKSNLAIATELRLSVHTAKRHVANILLKLDLPTRVAAAVLADRLPV